MRYLIGSQCKVYNTGVMWSNLDVLQIILVAEFCARAIVCPDELRVGQHRGKTSAHAPNYENMAGNLNINF